MLRAYLDEPAGGPFFFYGTLMDGDVLAAVVGGAPSRFRRRPAVAEGYRRVYRAGASYPILVARGGGRVDGLLVSGLAPREAASLQVFEGDEYELFRLPVITGGAPAAAWAFMARPWVPVSNKEWTLAAWQRKHKRVFFAGLRRTRRPT